MCAGSNTVLNKSVLATLLNLLFVSQCNFIFNGLAYREFLYVKLLCVGFPAKLVSFRIS
jgi:hypothetical protein